MSTVALDLTGKTFGRLTALALVRDEAGVRRWRCKCECGNEATVLVTKLTSGKTSSCGCFRRETTSKRAKKHHDLSGRMFGEWTVLSEAPARAHKRRWYCRCSCGEERAVYQCGLLYGTSRSCNLPSRHAPQKSNMPGFTSWTSMIQRCTNPSHVYYSSYGGRGVKVCDRWIESFWNFYEDMGPRPDGKSLDRLDPNGNYEPGNCRWATPSQQQSNQRRSRSLVVEGKRVGISELATALGLTYPTVHSRLSKAGLL